MLFLPLPTWETVLAMLSPQAGTPFRRTPFLRSGADCAERPAAVKGAAPKARAKRTLDGENRSANIPREGMATSQDLLKQGRLFIMRQAQINLPICLILSGFAK